MEHNFFIDFTDAQIFSLWNSSQTLVEIAQKLGFLGDTLTRSDYEYISKRKTREVWKKYILGIDREREKQRPSTISTLPKEELLKAMNSTGIETVSHLALHFLLSEKHGRKAIKERVLKLNLPIKASLKKGISGLSATPIHYPKKFYEIRVGQKPTICPVCNFTATHSRQIELHHLPGTDTGPKNNRNPHYYRTTSIVPLCANCHTLEHRTGERLQNQCGIWKKKLHTNLKYKNPDKIFTNICPETYRLQKNYFIRWALTGPNDYKCYECGVNRWGPDQK